MMARVIPVTDPKPLGRSLHLVVTEPSNGPCGVAEARTAEPRGVAVHVEEPGVKPGFWPRSYPRRPIPRDLSGHDPISWEPADEAWH